MRSSAPARSPTGYGSSGSRSGRVSTVGGFTGPPTVPDDRGELFFAKPRTIVFYRVSPISSFGGQCPGYQGVRWSVRGDQIVFSHPEGHCREYSLDALTFKPWTRVS